MRMSGVGAGGGVLNGVVSSNGVKGNNNSYGSKSAASVTAGGAPAGVSAVPYRDYESSSEEGESLFRKPYTDNE